MPLTGIDKVKLNKYLKEHANGDIYYLDMCDYLGKRGKIKDYEFLEHFTDCVVNEFSKNSKVSLKHLAKMVSIVGSFLTWIHEAGSEINEEVLDKIRSFGSLYEDYLERTGLECETTFRDECIGEVIEMVNTFYPSNNDSDSLAKYVFKIKELEEKVKELERIVEDKKREISVLESNLEKANLNMQNLSGENASIREELKEKKHYLKSVELQLDGLNERLSNLDTLISETLLEKEELSIYKGKFEELSAEYTKLEKIISDYKEKEEKVKSEKEKTDKLESIIYQKLLVENASVSDLLSAVEQVGISSDINEVSKVLREMRKKVNVVNGSFDRRPTYKIVKPKLMANGKFVVDVPFECKHMDVMLVSDFHIKEFDSKVLSGFDMLNDYCCENGISLILNLGDFYQGFSAKTLDYENACKNYKIVEESIDVIPRADGLYHAVLGGNHERNIANYGFDPIKMLVEGRDDFIDLGYYHSTVCLDGVLGTTSKFDLHHPSRYNFPIDLDDEGLTVDDMNDYLDEVYSKYNRSRDDSYIDIFGHTHRNQFNFASGYCYIPPFFEGKSKRGACHLRIYFDENSDIKYMVFMPLIVSNKLVKNNEIVYQKVLSR